jgi:hypothetical protein
VYLNAITIKNLKLIRNLRLDLGDPARKWTVILGENGLCKTTILQAIAMAASGAGRTNQIANVLSMPDLRVPTEPALISGTFSFGPLNGKQRKMPLLSDGDSYDEIGSSLEVRPGAAETTGRSAYLAEYGQPWNTTYHPDELPLGEGIDEEDRERARRAYEKMLREDPLREARSLNHGDWLVLGYGTSRVLPEPGTAPPPSDVARSRVESLFKPIPLVGTDFIDHLRLRGTKLALHYAETLENTLFEAAALLPGLKRFERRGQGGVKQSKKLIGSHRFVTRSGLKLPATWLSQGYQSMITLIADLLGHAWWDAEAEVDPKNLSALVLIDELDLHIHPTWQVHLIGALKQVFPQTQFIVTTHSPMMLSGLEADEIVRLGRDEEGSVIVLPTGASPRLMTGTDLYREYFGVADAHPDELGAALARYGALVGDPGRSEADDRQMQADRVLLARHGIDPGWEPVPVDPTLRRADP